METLEGAAKDHCMPEFLPAPPWTGRGQEQAARFVPQSMLEANTCESWDGCWRWRGQVAKKQWHRDLQGNHHPQGSPKPLMVQDLGEDGGAVRFTAMHSATASARAYVLGAATKGLSLLSKIHTATWATSRIQSF